MRGGADAASGTGGADAASGTGGADAAGGTGGAGSAGASSTGGAGGTGTARGRRPGGDDTRAQILDTARRLFAERGLRATTIRAVAGEASCDPALIHHYFGTKQDLFLAATEVPIDPEVVRARIRAVPFPELGRTLTSAVLTVWESTDGDALAAHFRAALAEDHGDEISDFLLSAAYPVLLDRLREHAPDLSPADADLRLALALSQLLGAVMGRRFLRMQALTAMGIGDLAASIGPVLQRHLEGRTD